MEPSHERSIILRPDFGIEKPVVGESRIVAAMVNETLAVARLDSQQLHARFKIGAYEWCEPDYRQLLVWAKALNFEPEEVIYRLLEGKMKGLAQSVATEWTKTVFADGRLLRLNWSFDLLPLESFEWVDGLALTHLAFQSFSKRVPILSLRLPSLTHLLCNRLGLRELDLSSMPKLKSLNLGWERLTTLDISGVPQLTYLGCGETPITRLDLSKVPSLTWLVLESNQLTELDLSYVPMLKTLHCAENQLTELDLTKMPMLTTLCCLMNKIAKLRLAEMPELTNLCCWVHELTELDLSKSPMLTELDCGTNKLTELDIRALQHLTKLRYDADTTHLIHRPDQDAKHMLENFYLSW